jgi:hypothetical protein
MKIAEIFRRPIGRTIEEVIKVDLADEEIVAIEIDEYVATEHIKERLEDVLDVFQDTINSPSERTNVWVSGFFGSGKSSFAKMLGYLIENPSVNGRSALDRFKERADAPTIEALLNTAHAQAPTLTVFLDLSTGRNVAKEGESIVLPVYRALLERLDYSRNLLLAELEFDLEGDGDLASFEEKFQQVAKDGKTWTERRNVGLAKNEASHALHLLRPDTYPNADSWSKTAQEPEVTHNWFAERALRLLERRGRDRRRVLFVVDEVGQYVARSVHRMLDLQGLAEAIQKRRGPLWLVVTSQERLDDVVDSLEGKQVELARVQDRFPIRVDLLPSDIEEVTSRRVLDKTAAGQDALRVQVTANRNKLIANVRLSSPTRADDPSEDDVLRLYPLVPYQVQLLIDAVSARRARGGASPILGGSNRTIIKLAQQLVVDPRAGLGNEPVGVLVTIDRAYDLLESVIPTAWQSEVEQVSAKYGAGSIEAKTIRAAALCSDVGALSLSAENLAVLLHPAIDAESVLPGVRTACEHLVEDDRLRAGDNGYQLQSAEQKDWEKARRQIDLRPADATRIRRLILKDALAGLTVQRGRTFKIEATVEGEKLTDGDIALHIEQADTNRLADLRSLSREAAAKSRVTWVFEDSDDTYEAVLELHRSRSMIERKDTPSKTAAEVELLGEERVRQNRWERLVTDRLGRDLAAGQIIFRGVIEDAPTGAIRAAAQKAVADHIDEIYERIDQFSANVTGKDVLAVLHADNLDGLSADLREDGIGLTHTTPQGEQVVADRDPLLAVLTEIRDRAAYGNEATGKHLESRFAAPPYGAPVEVVQAILAAGIRCGLIDVIHQGSRIRGSADQRLDRVFGALPQFRAASFVPPVDDEVSLDVRAELAERLGELLGTHPPVATDQLAVLVRATFASDVQITSRVNAGLRGAGLPIPEPVTRTASILDRIENGTDAEVVTTTAQSWVDLSRGREVLRALDTVLQQDLESLRAAQQQVRGGDDGLSTGLAAERRELADLLDGDDLPGHIARIRSITERIRAERTASAGAAALALGQKLDELRERIHDRYADVDEAVLEEALRPLANLVPSAEVSAYDYRQLAANLEAVDGRANKVARQLDEILAQGKVAHIVVNDLVSKPITTEDELDGALDRIREAAAAELANGKQVRFE